MSAKKKYNVFLPISYQVPATDPITPGEETQIEISKEKLGLGLSIVGGSDTLLVGAGMLFGIGITFFLSELHFWSKLFFYHSRG